MIQLILELQIVQWTKKLCFLLWQYQKGQPQMIEPLCALFQPVPCMVKLYPITENKNVAKCKCSDAKIYNYCNKLCIILKIFTQKWLRIVKSIVCLISGGSWSNALGLGILQQWKSIVTSPNSDLIIFTIRATYYILFTIKSMYSTYYII